LRGITVDSIQPMDSARPLGVCDPFEAALTAQNMPTLVPFSIKQTSLPMQAKTTDQPMELRPAGTSARIMIDTINFIPGTGVVVMPWTVKGDHAGVYFANEDSANDRYFNIIPSPSEALKAFRNETEDYKLSSPVAIDLKDTASIPLVGMNIPPNKPVIVHAEKGLAISYHINKDNVDITASKRQ
jgi:hypothetical protein